MSNIKEREKYDDYEMLEEYDFSDGIGGRFYEHTQLLKKHNIEISMNGRGRSIDNIVIERFFRTLKHSNIYINDYITIKDLKEGVAAYIHKYNFKRFHSSLNYQRPMNVYLEYLKSVA